MTLCAKCGREKIMAEQAVTGFPDYHVAGSRVEYCGVCDEPPVLTLCTPGPPRWLVANPSVVLEKEDD